MEPVSEIARYVTDCRRCVGLCCSVFAHLPVNGFPAEKPSNQPCRNLGPDHRCLVFDRLEAEGYRVCRAYDCHGAGPLVTAWIRADGAATPQAGRFEDFRQLSRLHLLIEAIRRDTPVSTDVSALLAALDAVSLVYYRDGVFTMTKAARDEMRRAEPLISAALERLGDV
jgi:hypothetical protein